MGCGAVRVLAVKRLRLPCVLLIAHGCDGKMLNQPWLLEVPFDLRPDGETCGELIGDHRSLETVDQVIGHCGNWPPLDRYAVAACRNCFLYDALPHACAVYGGGVVEVLTERIGKADRYEVHLISELALEVHVLGEVNVLEQVDLMRALDEAVLRARPRAWGLRANVALLHALPWWEGRAPSCPLPEYAKRADY